MSIYPTEALEQADLIIADTTSAANSAVDGTVARCPNPILNIGIFFDGTFNNVENVAAAGEGNEFGYTTNVARLAQRYFVLDDEEADENLNDCGEKKNLFRSRYIIGIGTETGEGDDPLSGASGHYRRRGLEDRLDRANSYVVEQVNLAGGLANLAGVKIDVFGFSRGSATARVFANGIASNGIDEMTVRFLGVYDTVGSFGLPGDNPEMGVFEELAYLSCRVPVTLPQMQLCVLAPTSSTIDLNIRSDTAEVAYHIVARHEFRSFFPVSLAKPGHATEVLIPGSHGDSAGAQASHTVTETIVNPPEWMEAMGIFEGSNRQFIDYPLMSLVRDQTRYTRTVYPGLGQVSLAAMALHARNASVPMHAIEFSSREAPGSEWDLIPLYQSLVSGTSLPDAELHRLARRYAKMSFAGLGPNMLTRSDDRDRILNRP